MNKLFLVLVCLLLNSSVLLKAQICGTEVTESVKEYLDGRNISNNRFSSIRNLEVSIPIKFHSITRDDGSGGLTNASKDNLINQINSFYSNAGLLFEHQGDINYINSSDLFDYDVSEQGLATIGNSITGVINVYLFNTVNSNGRALCGYTFFPPSADNIFVAYNCVSNGNTTLEHELGHYFTLYHTHGTTNTGTTDELVDGSNCTTAGDRLCDTPADPNLSGLVNSNCAYVGTLRDANGDSYQPDVTNVMAYSLERCQDKFSRQQYERVRTGFEIERSYLNFTSTNFVATFSADLREQCVNKTITFEVDAFGASNVEWYFEGGDPQISTSERPTVAYNEQGSFEVILKAFSNSGDSVVVRRRSYIRIVDPIANSFNEEINLDFNSNRQASELLQIENPDLSNTFELKNFFIGDDSVSLFVIDNFSYLDESFPNKDDIVFPYYNNSGVSYYDFGFEYAYAFRSATISTTLGSSVYDSLSILINKICGESPILNFKDGGESLATAEADSIKYVPSVDEFVYRSFKHIPQSDEEFFQPIIRSESYNGNNLYIKSIFVKPNFSVEIPSNFRYVQKENDSILFRWLDNSNNELEFVIEESIDSENFTETYSINPDKQSTLIPITSKETKYYRLKAVGKPGFESDYTDVVEVSESILDNKKKMLIEYRLYPNPVNNTLKVERPDVIKEIDYEIFDLSGNILFKGSLKKNMEIDLHELAQGVYFINLRVDQNQQVFKIVKK